MYIGWYTSHMVYLEHTKCVPITVISLYLTHYKTCNHFFRLFGGGNNFLPLIVGILKKNLSNIVNII